MSSHDVFHHFNGVNPAPVFTRVIPEAKEAVEDLLRSLESLRYSFFSGDREQEIKIVATDNDRLLGYGESAVVFELGKFGEIPMLVKFNTYGNCERDEFPDHMFLPGYSVYDLWGYADGMKTTIEALQLLGIKNIPFHAQYRTMKSQESDDFHPLAYHICIDLREGGSYSVHEASEIPEDVTNISELQEDYNRSVKSIYKAVGGGEASSFGDYSLKSAGHRSEAVERMFFVRVNKQTKVGELIPGDLDHLVIHKKSLNFYLL